MKFDDLDSAMRVYETASDLCVLANMFMVARLDGRSFTRLTKEQCEFETPYDERFSNLMVATTESLMSCGFKVLFAFTESDEISLLFDPRERQFGRKLRTFNSVLAGEASAQFSLRLGQAATFDCRVLQLPSEELVVDYFRWRNQDAARNALNSWCYWTLRKAGLGKRDATDHLAGRSVSEKHDLLFSHGINFNAIPKWQRRGVALYWKTHEQLATNPKTNQRVVAQRRRIHIDRKLPMKDAFADYVRSVCLSEEATRS
ncbi:MAG: tRNA(His) guanylyltransferase Thg1 family protein [Planctomycetota bacterium]